LIKDKKTVIYSNWLDFGLRPISETLTNQGVSNKTFSGDLSMREKKRIVDDFNEDKFQVLIISKSGSEGLDLKGVRNVIVMDPVWNYAGIKQIRGRAVRFQSHIKLPKNERNVDIYYMILETGRKDCKSGDSVVYDIVKQKKKNSESVDKALQKVSI
jgi:superfamily II DNA/RNA helicase